MNCLIAWANLEFGVVMNIILPGIMVALCLLIGCNNSFGRW